MKALLITIATISLIMLSTTNVHAENFKTLRMPLTGGKVLEIMVKIESAIEETIPGYHTFLKAGNRSSAIELTLPVYREEVMEENHPKVKTSDSNPSEKSLLQLVTTIRKTEEEVNDHNINTHAIFTQIIQQNSYTLSNEKLSEFTKTESEVQDPGFLKSMIVTAK